MRFYLLIVLAAGFVLAKSNWKPLFNGTTFDGWYIAGNSSYWKIQDSAIVGSSTELTPYTMVFTDRKDFDQFTIKYSYRLKAGCSGFFFRSKDVPTTERVEGMQVEAKFEGGGLREVGSLYCHQCGQWKVQHTNEYSTRIARTTDLYQDVVLTVKNPYIYVNVNGYQAVGETDLAEIRLGAKEAWNYVGTALINTPGNFGLQIHGGQRPMDVRFKNIAILEGCGDAAKPGFDGAFVKGLPKQPAVYQDNSSCNSSSLEDGAPASPARHFGALKRDGAEMSLEIKHAGANSLEIVSLGGRTLFSGTAPGAHAYTFTAPSQAGVYLAKIRTREGFASRKILIQ